jgi:steroid 5-alpha reductase family enzyme
MKNCQDLTNFPLALNKRTDLATVKEEMIYDYQLIRVSGAIINERTQIDRYAFRVNKTSRFFLNLGMHSLVS